MHTVIAVHVHMKSLDAKRDKSKSFKLRNERFLDFWRDIRMAVKSIRIVLCA